MKLAIIVPIRRGFGTQGFYNRQDLGLGKALARLGHTVYLVRCSDADAEALLVFGSGAQVTDISKRSLTIGAHGLTLYNSLKRLNLDAAIVFADIQLSVPYIFRWCRRNSVIFWPYIGTISSNRHRKNPLNDLVRRRNLAVYRKSYCLVKTLGLQEELRKEGVTSTSILQVGLDTESLSLPASLVRQTCRERFGIPLEKRVAGFVGRFEEYKRPLDMLHVLSAVALREPQAHLLIVGSGPLEEAFRAKLASLRLESRVTHVRQLAQEEMGVFYRAIDVLVNLNPNEIFGMSLMESLYYGTPVVAVRAPGPEHIISSGKDGFLVDSSEAVEVSGKVVEILNHPEGLAPDPEKIIRFSWDESLRQSGFPWPPKACVYSERKF